MRLHGGNQRSATGHVGDPLTDDPVDDRRIEPLQQPHPLGQCPLEVELAPHGPERNGLDALAHPRHVAQLVDALLLDHGGIHVGNQQPLAPVVDRDHGGIDGKRADVDHEFRQPLEIRHLAGLRRRQPVRRLAP